MMKPMQFNKILIPLDGSEMAERVVLPAVRLAEAVSAKLVLATVITPLPRAARQDTVESVVQSRSFEAGLYLKSVRKRSLPTTIEVETAVLSGPAAQTIITYAQENGVDLIVMTTHGRSGLTRWSFGRVTEKVLRRAPCPTVILRSEQELAPEHIQRILAPLDGSALAEDVLAGVLAVAANLRADVLLLRVVEPVSHFGFGHEESIVPEIETHAAQTYLEEVQQKVRDTYGDDIPISCHVEAGPAAETIIDFADEHTVDLIVLSSLGSSGIQMWMFGSVAERVMNGAHCATMVVRPETINRAATG